MRRLLVWIGRLALLTALSGGSRAWAAMAAHGFHVSGVVVSARDGSPIARCRVSVRPINPDGVVAAGDEARPGRGGDGAANPRARQFPPALGQDSDSVLTDGRGRFSLPVESAGLWRLTGSARGFRTQSYDQHEGFSAAIAVSAAEPEPTLTLRLTPDASISGIVFDEAGEPVRAAQVTGRILSADADGTAPAGRGRVASAQADDRGHYEMTGLAPGSYRLSVQAVPWYAAGARGLGGVPAGSQAAVSGPALDPSLDVVYAPTWYPAATDERTAEPIVLAGGEERQADFHLTPIPSIHLLIPRAEPAAASGQAADAPPRALRAPSVVRQGANGGFAQGGNVTVTAAGEWEVSGLVPGTYQVRVPDANGRGTSNQTVTLSSGAQTVSLGSAISGSTVTLRVDGVPARSVRQITLTNAGTGESFLSATGRGGVGGRRGLGEPEPDEETPDPGRSVTVPPGRYTVSVTGEGGVFLTGITPQEGSGVQSSGRTVTLGAGPATLTLHLATGRATLTGVARLAGKAVEGAMVLLVPASFGQPDALATVVRDETNTDGSFRLQNVIPGPYILVALDHGWGVNWRDETTLAAYLIKGTPVQLGSGASLHLEVLAVAP